jgi:hypothetical protein
MESHSSHNQWRYQLTDHQSYSFGPARIIQRENNSGAVFYDCRQGLTTR